MDTNVYTKLVEDPPAGGYPAVRRKIVASGLEICLSPVNILEFIQARDDVRREELIAVAQQLCGPKLLVEVEGIVTHQIADESGRVDLRKFLKVDPFGNSALSLAWQDIRADKDKTFVFDREQLKRFEVFRQLFSLFHAGLRRGDSVDVLAATAPSLMGTSGEAFAEVLKRAATVRRVQAAPTSSRMTVPVQDSVLLVTATLLCGEITLFSAEIQELWLTLRIGGTMERLQYTLSVFPFVTQSGPLVALGGMMAAQALRSHDPGNLFDCYHVAYLPHVEAMFTNDHTLVEIARSFPNSPNLAKVRPFDEFVEEYLGA